MAPASTLELNGNPVVASKQPNTGLNLNDVLLLRTTSFVNGRFVNRGTGDTFSVLNPFNNSIIAQVTSPTDHDVGATLISSTQAFSSWRDTPHVARLTVIEELYNQMSKHKADLATIITAENGKAYKESLGEVDYALGYVASLRNGMLKGGSAAENYDTSTTALTIREPVGIVLAVTPWNFPLAMLARKLVPALLSGCTMISKPSELTPLSALALAELCSRAKVPPGVFSVLPTAASRETCAKIAAHRDVRMITFTGSTRVGRALSALASQRMQRTAMELGGLASFIVCHDADIEKAVTGVIGAKFRNGGQSCVAVNRLYCHSEVADEFVSRLRERISEFVVIGDGFDLRTTVAPMINRDSVLRVERLIDDAVEAGARLLYRAEIPEIPEQAAFCAPTLLVDVPKDSKVMRTEIFGPVVAVCTFADYDEMIQDANDTEMGLASYVFSEGLGTAHKVTNALQVGMIGVNEVKLANWRTNFGGVKQSGIGREGAGDCALNCYTQLKYVLMKHS